MKKPKLHPLIAWDATATAPAAPTEASLDATKARFPGASVHVDYDHRPLNVGPLDHFDLPADSERFMIR